MTGRTSRRSFLRGAAVFATVAATPLWARKLADDMRGVRGTQMVVPGAEIARLHRYCITSERTGGYGRGAVSCLDLPGFVHRDMLDAAEAHGATRVKGWGNVFEMTDEQAMSFPPVEGMTVTLKLLPGDLPKEL